MKKRGLFGYGENQQRGRIPTLKIKIGNKRHVIFDATEIITPPAARPASINGINRSPSSAEFQSSTQGRTPHTSEVKTERVIGSHEHFSKTEKYLPSSQ